MGQKVSPIGLRIGINKDWESRWFADRKDTARFLENDVKIRKFLEKTQQFQVFLSKEPLRKPMLLSTLQNQVL